MTRPSCRLVLACLCLYILMATPPARAALELDLQLSGLTTLVDIAHAGDGRLFLARQQGQILVWNRVAAPTVFLDISSLMGSGFEGGIKSVAFPPDFGTSGHFFVHYSNVAGDSIVARYGLLSADLADPASGVTLITQSQTTTLHRGGQLAFDPEGMLRVGFGDGGPQTDTSCNAQRPETFRGKMLRIDVTQNVATPPFYGIPADNPFIGPGDMPDEVWAYGLRQPWRFSFDRHRGDLYIADVGQVNREEVDVEPAGDAGGRNYGWRVMEGNSCHDPDPIDTDCPLTTPSCGSPAYTAPVLDYPHGTGDCSVAGGFVYRGREHAELVGRYLYGDFCSGRIWATSAAEGWTSDLLDVDLANLITFGEDAWGTLFLSEGSNLYRLADPIAVFVDGFESGDTSAWNPLPVPP